MNQKKEPSAEEVLPAKRTVKKKGQRDLDLKDFPEEILPPYSVSEEQLDAFYGKNNWRRMPDETYKRLRHEPESWTVEIHTVEVYVGTDGDHQDEFLRGNRPRDLLRNSIVTPSLLASILNVKYVNSSALHRIEQEFQRNGVNISRQTMSNWIVKCSQMYFTPFVERMKQELLSLHVTQSDETPTQVIADSDHPNSKCYMWVHRSGEFYTRRPIVVYEYQKGRDHQKTLDFYKDYKGVLVTDSLHQYHLVDKKLPDVTNANCWAHARRKFDEALQTLPKEMQKDSPAAIGECYCSRLFKLEQAFAELTPEERYEKRLKQEKPVLDALLSWANEMQVKTAPKSALGRAIHYLLEQWPYLTRYLEDGRLELSNNRAERSIKPFVMGRKNWLFANTAGGARASSLIYSLIETAKENGLDPYRYLLWILRNAPQLSETDEAWAEKLLPARAPKECYMPQ